MQIALKNYKKLLQSVQKIVRETQKNIVENVNREKVVMSWQIGKIIEEHLLENNRAEYGVKFFAELEKDTAISTRVLYQMRSFYRAYPTLPAQESDLSWSHYRSLSSLGSEESRKRLEQLTVAENLGATVLQSKISKIKKQAKERQEQNAVKKITKLSLQRGRLFTYKIVVSPHSGKTLIDCGFNIFSQIKTSLKTDGAVVESVKKNEGFALKKAPAKKRQLHTYKAFLDKVVDGDTLHVTLDLGFKIEHKVILRLAKINAAEIDSDAGKKSAAAVTKILQNVKFLIVKTNKTDVYGRYVADVFFDESAKESDPQKVADKGNYLNQMLLDLGLANNF
ncbi:MAG: DUF1016 family protein [Proteobacteria bacterium]|nr:DUF1016 family protein [Pseudomonadota bacterium]